MKQSEIKILTDDELVDKLESLIKSQEDTKLTHVFHLSKTLWL